MSLSYTQNLEDYQLSIAFAGQETGFYIDIGGGHPVADNVSLWFYERGWQGIVVEPQAKLAALYARVRPRDICAETLIGAENRDVEFHVFDKFHGLSSIHRTVAEKAENLGEAARVVTLPMLTLAELCDQHQVGGVDFLKVDVEGAEIDVLKGNDWARFRPKVIVLEAIAPGTGLPAWDVFEPYLLAQGYEFALFDELNRFYVAKEHPEILARFSGGRAAWDSATHMYEIGLAPLNKVHPDHGLSRDLAKGLWASLNRLDAVQLAELALKGQGGEASLEDKNRLIQYFESQAGRIALARIACGFDGGQIVEEGW